MNLFFLIIGIIGEIWCILPIFTFRIFNIGNGTGLVVFTAFILVGIFWKRFKAFIKKLKQKKAGRIFVRVCSCFLLLILILTVVETVLMISATAKTPDGDETIIVLGSKVNPTGPSLMTARRLDAAYDYMTAHPDSVCILSGGKGTDEVWSEAEGMADYLIKRGIDEDRLYLEPKSTNTRENLKYSMEIIKANNFNEKVILISNEFHLYRAGLIARSAGIDYATIPARSVLVLLPTYYIRELYAILQQWILY